LLAELKAISIPEKKAENSNDTKMIIKLAPIFGLFFSI